MQLVLTLELYLPSLPGEHLKENWINLGEMTFVISDIKTKVQEKYIVQELFMFILL